MVKISIIAALSENGVIGRDNKIPWHIKEDLVRLKEKTRGHAVILGRKTFESMVGYYDKSGNPLPGKVYIIVTHDTSYKPTRENAIVATSIDEAIRVVKEREGEEVFIIGGQKIFEQTIGIADKLYLTIVEGNIEGDAFFPDYSQFKKVVFEKSHDNGQYKYKSLELER